MRLFPSQRQKRRWDGCVSRLHSQRGQGLSCQEIKEQIMAEVPKLRVEGQNFAESKYRHGKAAGHLYPGEKKRPNVLKRCRHIQDLPGAIVQYGDPEYNGLACWVSDDEVTVAMKMKVRKSYTAADLARLSKLPEDRLQKALDHGSWAGLFSIDTEDRNLPKIDGKWQVGYHIPIFVPGIFEAMVDNIKLVEQYPIIAQSFAEDTIKRIMPLAGNIPVGHGVMRVIPIESAIKDNPDHKEEELISHYVDIADDISVAPCSCRVSRRLMGEGCGHLEQDMCIQFNEGARDFIKQGHGRRISKEECYARSEEHT